MGWTASRARVAALSRDRKDDDPDLVQARLDFAADRRDRLADRLAEDIARAVADAPPLTQAQRDRIVQILGYSTGSAA